MKRKTVIVHIVGKGEIRKLSFFVPAGISLEEFIGEGYSAQDKLLSYDARGSEWALDQEKQRLTKLFDKHGLEIEWKFEPPIEDER